MPETPDEMLFDDPMFDVDPECDKQPSLPTGTYSNAEYQSRIIGVAPQSIPTKNGEVAFVNINCLIVDPEQGGVFARTQPFGPGSTPLAKNSGSSWPQYAANLGLDARPKDGEGIGAYWARIGEEAKDLPVTVTVGLRNYVRREDQLTDEERMAGKEPRRTYQNFIRNIVRE